MWRIHFLDTIVRPEEHGKVHIWVVNTESQLSFEPRSPRTPAAGEHWFVAAWLIHPSE
jgi:hypothetical protein